MHGVDLRNPCVPDVIRHQQVLNGNTPPKSIAADQKIQALTITDPLAFHAGVYNQNSTRGQILSNCVGDLLEGWRRGAKGNR
jgi:hypothetical protein